MDNLGGSHRGSIPRCDVVCPRAVPTALRVSGNARDRFTRAVTVNVGAQSRTPTARTFPKDFLAARLPGPIRSQSKDCDYSPCSLTNFPFGSTSNPDCLPFALTNT